MNINFKNYHAISLAIFILLLWYCAYFIEPYMSLYLKDITVLQRFTPLFIVLSILVLYDRFLWKNRFCLWLARLPVPLLPVSMPNLNGDYEGEISYRWEGKDCTKNCNLKIKQTASYINVTSIFSRDDEASTKSESKEALLTHNEVGAYSLTFFYHNEGSCKNGDTLDQHDGACKLSINLEDNTIVLDGYYFTNRNPQTKGRISIKKKR